MRVDLDNLYWYQARDVLDYCSGKGIDLVKVQHLQAVWASPILLADDQDGWVLDIPDEHVCWLTLRGLL